MPWQQFQEIDKNEIRIVKAQLHHLVQSVAAVGRHMLPEVPEDENAILKWHSADKSLKGMWIDVEGKERVRASLQLQEKLIQIENEAAVISSQNFQRQTFSKLMMWVEGQLGELGFPVDKFSGNLPYEIPAYPTRKGGVFEITNDEALLELLKYYHNSSIVLNELIPSFETATEIRVWPHHFDQATSIKLKDSGNAETSTYLGIGFSPGDEHYDEPYFYVNSWPYAEEDDLEPLPHGNWHTDNWVGAVLLSDEIRKLSNQKSSIISFCRTGAEQLRSSLMK